MSAEKKQAKFIAMGVVLTVVVAAVVGFTVWFAYHSSQVADASLRSANKVSSDIPKIVPAATDFASCQKSPGSITQQTYPEKCVTKAGKSFTDPTKYLVIKEWGVKIPLSADDSGVYYSLTHTIQQPADNPTNLTLSSTQTDSLTGSSGTSCKGDPVAYLLRLPKDDSRWQPSVNVDDGRVPPTFIERVVIGNYKYAVSTHSDGLPYCLTESDIATKLTTFNTVANSFSNDFKSVTSAD